MGNSFIKHLEKLIACKSVTPLDSGAIDYISDLLQENGFRAEIKIFGNDEYSVTNLYGVYGNSSPNICFAGHVDVVPPGDSKSWKYDPFTATTEGDKIFGRGAVDMKGALACALSSSLDFIKSNPNPNGSISFLITSDEEGKAEFGTKEMLSYLYSQKDFKQIDLAILGEPTCVEEVGDTIKIGRRGSVSFTLIVQGMQGHVAYPDLADNPIPYLIKILNELNNYKLDEGNEFFQSSNLEITSVDVNNNATNVIPQEASAKFNIRFNNIHSPESIVELVKNLINRYSTNYKLNSYVSALPFIQKPIGLIEDFADIVSANTGVKCKFSTSGGTSDARFISNYCNVVEFGLLSGMAHKINEHTGINDLQRLHNVYYNALNKFLR